MSSQIGPGPGRFIKDAPHKSIYTPNQMAQQRDFMDQALPCKPLHEIYLRAEPEAPSAFKPLFGHQRGSSFGLSRNPEHPTNLPLMKRQDPFNPGKSMP